MRHTLLFLSLVSLTGCYTVLRQSGDYYSEFSENPAATPQEESVADSSDFATESEAIYNNYNYYFDGPYYPPYYYDPWGYRYGHMWAGLYIPLTWDPWYYDYYYWGGCYYPGSYPHYIPYYPNPPGSGLHTRQRPYGLRNTAMALNNQPLTASVRTAQWNGSATRRYKSSEPSLAVTPQKSTKNTTAAGNRTTQRTFGSGRVESTTRNFRSETSAAKPSNSSNRATSATGQRQYRGKSR